MARGAAADDAAVRRLRRRLALALVFFVPLTDASLMLSVFGWTRFPGWQWLLVALAVPVATWAAWGCGRSLSMSHSARPTRTPRPPATGSGDSRGAS